MTVAQLYALDKAKYHTKNPKIYGNHAVPRLAQIMEIDAVTVRFDQSQAEGWMLSSQLHGASAKGWSGETGNFITRYYAAKQDSMSVWLCHLRTTKKPIATCVLGDSCICVSKCTQHVVVMVVCAFDAGFGHELYILGAIDLKCVRGTRANAMGQGTHHACHVLHGLL